MNDHCKIDELPLEEQLIYWRTEAKIQNAFRASQIADMNRYKDEAAGIRDMVDNWKSKSLDVFEALVKKCVLGEQRESSPDDKPTGVNLESLKAEFAMQMAMQWSIIKDSSNKSSDPLDDEKLPTAYQSENQLFTTHVRSLLFEVQKQNNILQSQNDGLRRRYFPTSDHRLITSLKNEKKLLQAELTRLTCGLDAVKNDPDVNTRRLADSLALQIHLREQIEYKMHCLTVETETMKFQNSKLKQSLENCEWNKATFKNKLGYALNDLERLRMSRERVEIASMQKSKRIIELTELQTRFCNQDHQSPSTSRPKLKCPKCNKDLMVIRHSRNRRRHVMECKGNKSVKCETCGISFGRVSDRNRHKKNSCKGKRYK